MKQSQMALFDLDTQEAAPEGTASLLDWIKNTEMPVYLALFISSYECQVNHPRGSS